MPESETIYEEEGVSQYQQRLDPPRPLDPRKQATGKKKEAEAKEPFSKQEKHGPKDEVSVPTMLLSDRPKEDKNLLAPIVEAEERWVNGGERGQLIAHAQEMPVNGIRCENQNTVWIPERRATSD